MLEDRENGLQNSLDNVELDRQNEANEGKSNVDNSRNQLNNGTNQRKDKAESTNKTRELDLDDLAEQVIERRGNSATLGVEAVTELLLVPLAVVDLRNEVTSSITDAVNVTSNSLDEVFQGRTTSVAIENDVQSASLEHCALRSGSSEGDSEEQSGEEGEERSEAHCWSSSRK